MTDQKDKELIEEIEDCFNQKAFNEAYNILIDNFIKRAEINARKEEREKILSIINKDRDEGNCEDYSIECRKSFSPALCLSKVIKYCEGQKE